MKEKNNKEKVSVIIPVYNVGQYIEQCIRSIQEQDYPNVEIVVVNDGSPDNSLEIIEGLASEDERIVVINKENSGVSASRNVGIKASTGEYLMFVDGDDFLAQDCVSYFMGLVKRTRSPFCISLDWFTEKGQEQPKADICMQYSAEDATALLLSPRVIVGSCNKIYAKTLFEENNLSFCEDLFYGEGLQLITTLAQFVTTVGVGNRRVYYYRRNNYSSATTHLNIEKFYNGEKSLDMIETNLKIKTPKVLSMIEWHRTHFKVGALVRLLSAHKQNEYKEYYDSCIHYVRKHMISCLKKRDLPFYNKAIILGCAISPKLMAKLDDVRRQRIQANSVVNYY